jgi:hypothetical protein
LPQSGCNYTECAIARGVPPAGMPSATMDDRLQAPV